MLYFYAPLKYNMRKVLTVVGTRPNFIKVSQFRKEFGQHNDTFELRMVHTGQHYDRKMSDVFFEQLKFGEMEYALNIAPTSPAKQMGEMMIKLDELYAHWKPDLVMVVGDVNSTLAAALSANKNNIKVAHVESGLRSFDRTMPEEHNRVLTDFITDIFFVTEPSGKENLLKEGKSTNQIFTVGNTMIDTLVAFDNELDQSRILSELKLTNEPYVLMTLHRPSNVDEPSQLNKLFDLVEHLTKTYNVVFPIHPRTRNNIKKFGLEERLNNIKRWILTEPLDYFAFQKLIKHSKFIVTDSGGIQEETTFRQTPCLTLRDNTERPVTVDIGTNVLIPFDLDIINGYVQQIENGTYKKGRIPEMWDGKSTHRIVDVLTRVLA